MKKAVALLLVVLFVFSLSACNENKGGGGEQSEPVVVETEIVSSTPEQTSSEDTNTSSTDEYVSNNYTPTYSSTPVASSKPDKKPSSSSSSQYSIPSYMNNSEEEDTSGYKKDFFLKRGINLSTDINVAGSGFAQPRYMEMIKEAGFDHVRMPMRFEGPTTAIERKKYFENFKKTAKMATDAGLYAIVDMHKVAGINEDPYGNEQLLYTIWSEISNIFKKESKKVIFEIINEPNDKFDYKALNKFQNECIRIIRKSGGNNATRWIAAAVAEMNVIEYADKLEIPKNDKNIFVTFHCYTPMSFTHQGTSNSYPVGAVWGTKEQDYEAMKSRIKWMADWGRDNDRYIHIGEMGNPRVAATNHRVVWFSTFSKLCKDYGLAWAVWDMNGEFGIYEPSTDQFNGVVLDSLMR